MSPYIIAPIEPTSTTPARRSARNRANSGAAKDNGKEKSRTKRDGAEDRPVEDGEIVSHTKVVRHRSRGGTSKKNVSDVVYTNGHVNTQNGHSKNHSINHSNNHSTNHSNARPDRVSTPSTGHSSDEDEDEAVETMRHQLLASSDPLYVDEIEAAEVDLCLDSAWLRCARHFPTDYLYIVSYVMVMSELISMMTPCVAMGIQWITALCDGPPVMAILELGWESFNCLRSGGIHCSFNPEQLQHCILRASKVWAQP